MSSRLSLTDARIFESRSTTCDSSRSLLLESSFSVAITCATELFNSGTRSRISRIVCCSMSSGFSVDSIIPPKRARIEREILLISPIFSPVLNQEMCDHFRGSQIPAPVYVRRTAAKGSKFNCVRETEYNRCCALPPRRPGFGKRARFEREKAVNYLPFGSRQNGRYRGDTASPSRRSCRRCHNILPVLAQEWQQ